MANLQESRENHAKATEAINHIQSDVPLEDYSYESGQDSNKEE